MIKFTLNALDCYKVIKSYQKVANNKLNLSDIILEASKGVLKISSSNGYIVLTKIFNITYKESFRLIIDSHSLKHLPKPGTNDIMIIESDNKHLRLLNINTGYQILVAVKNKPNLSYDLSYLTLEPKTLVQISKKDLLSAINNIQEESINISVFNSLVTLQDKTSINYISRRK